MSLSAWPKGRFCSLQPIPNGRKTFALSAPALATLCHEFVITWISTGSDATIPGTLADSMSYRVLMWPLSQSRITEKRNLPSAIASTMKT